MATTMETTTKGSDMELSVQPYVDHVEIVPDGGERCPIVRTDSYRDDQHVKIGWRSWMVVLSVANTSSVY